MSEAAQCVSVCDTQSVMLSCAAVYCVCVCMCVCGGGFFSKACLMANSEAV